MKKILASILAITMLLTTMSTCVIPASAEDAVATGAFKEDFENYGAGNWLANMADDGKTVGTAISGMSEKQWTIYTASGKTVADLATANASMEVVTEPGNEANKVLKLDAGNLASGDWFFFRRNASQGAKIARSNLPAKKMVVKAKYRLPSGYKSATDTAMLSYNSVDKGSKYISTQVGANYGSTTWTMLASGSKTYGYNNNVKAQASVPTEQWFEYKQVMDLTAHKTADHPSDTYRGFLDGVIYTMRYPKFTEAMRDAKDKQGNPSPKVSEVNSKYPQPSTTVGEYGDKVIDSLGGYTEPSTNTAFKDFGDYYGVAMVLSSAATDTDYMYMDDLEVYYVDAFAREGEATIEQNVDGAWYKGEIRIPFNNELKAEVTEVNYDESRTYGTDQYVHTYYTTTPTEKFLNKLDSEGVWNHRRIDYYYKELFTLKDEEGKVVEGGIANAYADGNELVIEPSKLLDRNQAYTISASPLFMDVEGQGLNSYSKEQDILTFDTAEDPFAHIIYSFNFEDNKVDGVNWIESRNNGADRYVVAEGVELGSITINKHSKLPADHQQSIKVENDPTGADNKVLALKAGYADATSKETGTYLEGWTTQIRFNANEKTGISRQNEMGKGKNLVYRAKIYIPSGFAMTESSQLVNTAAETQASANTVSGFGATMAGSFYAATVGSWGSPMARHQISLRDQWIEWKHVADVSEDLSAEHSDTVRAYVNNKMVTTKVVKSDGSASPFGANAKYDHNLYIGAEPIIDYLPAGKTLFTTTPYASLGATWWGSAFNINPKKGTTHGDTFYIDDVEAFWIDDLTFNAVNAANFEGGKVKLNFNQKIREEVEYMHGTNSYNFNGVKKLALADLFKVVDKAGNVVENGIAAVTLSADGKTVSIAPSGELEKGGDYQIEISPYLVDEYGQGLLNNSLPTYVDLHISETFTPFEMTSISQTSVSGFAQGRDVKITAKFSVAVDDESITDGIVVTNTDTNATIARNEGWTANFGTDEDGNVDYKTVVFDFGNLPTANYTVAINEYFLATNGAELASAFNITLNKPSDKIVLFEENFDNYAQENWLADKYEVTDGTLYNGKTSEKSKVYYRSYTVNDHDWDLQLHWAVDTADTAPSTLETNDFAGIAAAPTKANAKMSGNVFKMESTRTGSYSDNYVSFRRNFNKLDGIDFSKEEYKGKKLVYEADIYADSVASDNSFFVPFGGTNTKVVRDYNDWKMLLQGGALRSPGHYEDGFLAGGVLAMYSQIVPSAKTTDGPVNYRIVISMGENIDTLAYYSNGTLVQRDPGVQQILVGHEWNNSARHEFIPSDGTFGETLEVNDILYGVWGLVGQGAKTRTIYMDNFKAYLVDEFKVESVEGAADVFNTAKSAVTFSFSKPVNKDTAAPNEGVVLVNEAGKVVPGGIASVVFSDADYRMTVKLAEELPGETKYRVKLDETLTDADGVALSTEWKYYEYPIDDYYSLLYGAGEVYQITDVGKSTTLEMLYTPKTATKPAYLTYEYYNAKGDLQTRKAAVDTYVRDADAMKMYVELTTSKATSLYAVAGEATVNGKEISTTVSFTNPEPVPMGVVCVIAAFGEYDEMLGCTTVDISEVAASSSTESIPVNFTAGRTGVKSVKMFVWNNKVDIKPYQEAEELLK